MADINSSKADKVTTDKIKKHFSEIAKGNVVKYHLDNLCALNFILENSLGGGGSDTLINDAQGKTYGQALLMMDVLVPKDIYEKK